MRASGAGRYCVELPPSADLVVVGGGSVGAAMAFFACRAGLSVVLLQCIPLLGVAVVIILGPSAFAVSDPA